MLISISIQISVLILQHETYMRSKRYFEVWIRKKLLFSLLRRQKVKTAWKKKKHPQTKKKPPKMKTKTFSDILLLYICTYSLHISIICIIYCICFFFFKKKEEAVKTATRIQQIYSYSFTNCQEISDSGICVFWERKESAFQKPKSTAGQKKLSFH